MCPDEFVQKVVLYNSVDLFDVPFGPRYLNKLLLFENELLPLLCIDDDQKKCEKKNPLIVIIKKLMFFVAIIVDEVLKIVEIDKKIIDESLVVPNNFAGRALNYEGVECYLLDVDALFRGKE